ncbi:ABC transporter permease, partial [Mesorhizobium sp. M2D.F.Ca.ET.145.01.1.1]
PFGAALSVALAIVVIAAILIGERFGRSRGTSV